VYQFTAVCQWKKCEKVATKNQWLTFWTIHYPSDLVQGQLKLRVSRNELREKKITSINQHYSRLSHTTI